MNKEQLIDSMAEKAGISKRAAGDALDALLEGITESLGKGKSVMLSGFGTFKAVQRAARDGMNPSTGEKMQIPATTVAKFSAGKGLRNVVKNNSRE